MRPISTDLRIRILKDCDKGLRLADVASKFSVSLSFVKKLKHQRKTLGTIAPLPCKCGRKRALKAYGERIHQLIRDGEAGSLKEIREKLGVDVTEKTVWMELRRLGYSFKKDSYCS